MPPGVKQLLPTHVVQTHTGGMSTWNVAEDPWLHFPEYETGALRKVKGNGIRGSIKGNMQRIFT